MQGANRRKHASTSLGVRVCGHTQGPETINTCRRKHCDYSTECVGRPRNAVTVCINQ